MKWAIVLLLSASCFGQTIASRRYAEKNPLQFVFSGFQCLAPYCAAPGSTTIPDAVMLPSALVVDNNTFGSTATYNVFSTGTPAGSSSVSGNVLTVTTSTGTGQTFGLNSTGTSCSIGPNCFSEIEITQNGSGAGTDALRLGWLFNSGTDTVVANIDAVGHTASVFIFTGTSTTIGSVSFTPPSAPWYLAVSLQQNYVNVFYTTNLSSGWTLLTIAQIGTAFDATTTGNLTGAENILTMFATGATTWKFANWKTGSFGGFDLQNPQPVITPDGRNYMVGSLQYFTAGCGGFGIGTDYSAGSECVGTIDTSTNAISVKSVLFDTRGGHTYSDNSGTLVVDPASGTQRLMVPEWAGNTTSTVLPGYATWNSGTVDALSVGQHNVGAMTAMSIPTQVSGWDPGLMCTQWNYSAGTCGTWFMPYTSNNGGSPVACLQYTNSDPSVNTWTKVGCETSTFPMEEGVMYRTATGSAGTAYYPHWNGKINSSTRIDRAYNTGMTFQGSLSTFVPASGSFLLSPRYGIFAYGNTEYNLSSDENYWAGFSGQAFLPNLVLATAPKYPAASTWTNPTYVATCSGQNNSTSSNAVTCGTTLSVTSGDILVGFCAQTNTNAVWAQMTLGQTGIFSAPNYGTFSGTGGNGFDAMFVGFATATGTVTPKCWLGATNQFGRMMVRQYHPGSLTQYDLQQTFKAFNTATGTYTSASFSTAAKGLIVYCVDPAGSGGSTISAGNIGGTLATNFVTLGSGSLSCEDLTTNTSQTGITASMTNAGTQLAGSYVMALKGGQ